jgi:hypothetical protein
MSIESAHRQAKRVRRIAAIGQISSCAEGLRRNGSRRHRELLDSRASIATAMRGPISGKVGALIENPRTQVVLDVTGLLCGCAALVASGNPRVRTATAVVQLLSTAVARRRNVYGWDGADQMQQVITLYDAISGVVPDMRARDDLFLRSINAQAAVAYCASGLIKLVSDDWRSGRAFGLVMRTSAYGSADVSRIVERRPAIGFLMCWFTIVWETAFPVIYLLPAPAARLALRFTKLFHLATAHFMGIPRFFWAFTATHPAVEYLIALDTRDHTEAI